MRLALLRMSLVAGFCFFAVSPSRGQTATDQSVMQVDEAFRIAKLNRDTAALSRILADNFYEMNQNGNGRNKVEFIDLFKTFSISTLRPIPFKYASPATPPTLRAL